MLADPRLSANNLHTVGTFEMGIGRRFVNAMHEGRYYQHHDKRKNTEEHTAKKPN
jgi:hypothetical protein